uniref:Secreted protein n=1 Tax=Setaria viridis TaxID=4556 RepID=A0A4U6UT22_SETVI|nr:hypothetical protein SEVIR_5G389100v2 [Setaria viridis]
MLRVCSMYSALCLRVLLVHLSFHSETIHSRGRTTSQRVTPMIHMDTVISFQENSNAVSSSLTNYLRISIDRATEYSIQKRICVRLALPSTSVDLFFRILSLL